MMRLVLRLLAALLLLSPIAVACTRGPGAAGKAPASHDPRVISADEIARSGAENVLVLVHSLRPNWLRSRGATSVMAEGTLVAYMDGTRLGGPEALRQVSTEGIAMVRFFDAASASVRFGAGHQHGAIQVVSLVGSTAP